MPEKNRECWLGEYPELLEAYVVGGELLKERGIKGLSLGPEDDQWLMRDVKRCRWHPDETYEPPIAF